VVFKNSTKNLKIVVKKYFKINTSLRVAIIENSGIFRVTVPVTLSILRDDADQDGSFLLIDSTSTGNFHKRYQGEPAAPLLASVIRRVFLVQA
jgi:hypothetical protein